MSTIVTTTSTRKPKKGKKKTRKTKKTYIPKFFMMPPSVTINMTNGDNFLIENSSTVNEADIIDVSLSQMQGANDWRNIYDYYRINHATIIFTPKMTTSVNKPYDDTTTGNTINIVPDFFTSIDRDSNTAPASITAMELRRHRKNPATKQVVYKFVPTRLKQVYKSSTTTGYVCDSNISEWVDCANDDIPHYGLKYLLTSASPANAFVYEVQIKLNVSFAGKRG